MKTESQKNPISSGIIITAIGLCVLLIFFYFLWISWYVGRTNEYEGTKGKIITSQIHTQHGRNGTTYHPNIMYEYVVDGKTYTNNVIMYQMQTSLLLSNAYHYKNKYPIDKEVVVIYNIKNPTEAYLERSVIGSFYTTISGACYGLCICLTGIFVMAGFIPV